MKKIMPEFMSKQKINITFAAIKANTFMDIQQFLGFLVFMSIFTMGFWLLIFALTFIVPYWLIGSFMENLKLKREAKKLKS